MKFKHHTLAIMSIMIASSILFPAESDASEVGSNAELVSLDSELGRKWLAESKECDSFFKLIRFFLPQKNLSYCGVASSVMVLNALPVPKPSTEPHAPFAFFTQENFFTPAVEKLRPAAMVAVSGMSLKELNLLLNAHEGVATTICYADASEVEDFRTTTRNQMRSGEAFVIINYLRTSLGQQGGGHISPLGAYHQGTDRFLVLDVSQYKYPPVWVPTRLLWSAMSAGNGKHSRGYVIVRSKK